MKRISFRLVTATYLSLALLFAGAAQAGPLTGSYPVVLSHGILGFDDTQGLANGLIKYWGGMDDYLRRQGVAVLTPGKTAMQGLDFRAKEQKNQVLYWMAANGYTKVHIIGHSQGGLDSRYMITNLAMASKVSTLTTLNSVHRGTPVADIALAVIPSWLKPSVSIVVNAFAKLIYRSGNQDVLNMAKSLTTGYLKSFNTSTPNASGVKYYSYGSKMAWADPVQHPLMAPIYPITWAGGVFNGQGGANDGVVPFTSQSWGTWKGEPSTYWYTTGVDHLEATNFSRTGQTWYDVEGYFLRMASNAKANQ